MVSNGFGVVGKVRRKKGFFYGGGGIFGLDLAVTVLKTSLS